MTNLIPFIDWEEDNWTLKSNDDLSDYVFRFEFLPNPWFKNVIKRITRDTLIIGKLKPGTIYRYNYSLKIFFNFLQTYNIELENFKHLTFDIIESFVHYLLENVKKPSTRSLALVSLKHHIKHGQLFEWDGFPNHEVFDGTEFRTLQTEDSLKSPLLDDTTMKSIDTALFQMKSTFRQNVNNFNEIVLWALITVVRHTGIRLTEALNLNKDCIRRDFMKKYLLEVVSSKNDSERFIPVVKDVSVAIKLLIEITENVREDLNNDKIFYWRHSKKSYIPLTQYTARRALEYKFIKQFNIKKENGELAEFTYHQFRHQIGTDLLNKGLNTIEVMQYLGHDSMHSTRLYARVRNDRITQEYKKVGFIGVIEKKTSDIKNEQGEKLDEDKRLMAQLPDGICAKPINKKVINCKKPNACLFCPKFITTPEFIDTHKDHLKRIKRDKERYLAEDLMGSDYLLNETEKALEEIVSSLEAIQEKGEA